MDSIETFNKDIFEAIENDFNSAYSIVKIRKESQLLKDFSDKLTPQKTSEELFEEFINRYNIDLSFKKKMLLKNFHFIILLLNLMRYITI